MAYTLDDIKRIRDGVKTKKGDGASSSPSSDSADIERIKSIRDSVTPVRQRTVYDDYARMATQSPVENPTEPTYRYNSIDEYDKALSASPLNDRWSKERMGYTGKKAANAGINVFNHVANIGKYLNPSSYVQWAINGEMPNDQLSNIKYTPEEMAYEDLKTERNLYAAEHIYDERYKPVMNNADYKATVESMTDDDVYQWIKKHEFDTKDTSLTETYLRMTPEQKEVARYYMSKGEGEFQNYIRNMGAYVSKPYYEAVANDIKEYADSNGHDAVITAATTPLKQMGNFAPLEYAQSALYGTTPNPYGGISSIGNIAQEAQNYVAEDLTERYGDVAGKGYQIGTSMLDSFIGAKTFGKAYAPLMSGGVYNTTYKELTERGADSEEALYGALLAGGAEWAFETISLENLLKPKNPATFKQLLMEYAKQSGIEASEEYFTELANIMSEELVQGTHSDIQQMITKMRNNGKSEDEIKAEVSKYVTGRVGEAAIGGAISGGGLSMLMNTAYYADNVKVGKNTDRQALSDAISKLNPNSETYKKYNGKDLSSLKESEVGALVKDAYNEASKLDRDRYRNALVNALEAEGFNEDDAAEYAEAIVAEKKSPVQKLMLRDNAIVENITRNVNNTVGMQMLVEADNNARQIARTVGDRTGIAKYLKKSNLKVGARTELNGEDVKVKDVIKDGDTIKVVTESGEANPKELTLSANDAAMVVAASGIDNEVKRQAYIANYDGRQNVAEYTESFNTAYRYGRLGMSEEQLTEDLGESINLTAEQAANAFVKGQNEANTTTEKLEESFNDATKELEGFRKGKLTFDNVDVKSLNATQRGATTLAEMFNAMGLNVVLFNDSSDNSENGRYENGTVYINLSARYYKNAIKFDKGYVINTMAHELTHWMEDTAKTEFEALKKAIFDFYGEEKTKELIAKEQQRQKGLSDTAAESEVVARACEDMLSNADTIEKILMGVNTNTRQRIIDKFKEFFEKLGRFLKNVLSMPSHSEAATMLRENAEVFEQVRQQWIKTFTEAVNKVQEVEKAYNDVTEDYTKTESKQFSLKATAESTDKLMALHNVHQSDLLKTLKLGGFACPSIAIKKAYMPHEGYGDCTVVFTKKTIDPKASVWNNIFSGDAWTATFPKTEKKINAAKRKAIVDKVNNLVGGWENVRTSDLDMDNIADRLNSYESVANAYRNNEDLKYAFLQDTGKGFEMPKKEKAYYNELSNETLRNLVDEIGEDIINEAHETSGWYREHPEQVAKIAKLLDEAYAKEHQKEIEDLEKDKKHILRKDLLDFFQHRFTHENGEIDFYEFDKIISAMFGLNKRGAVQVRDDAAFKSMLEERVDQEAYEKWVEDLFDGIVEKEGYRNNVDYFTYSGNRRSFEALHYEATIENAVKIMRQQAKQGAGNALFPAQEIWGVATRQYTSIEDMKKDIARLVHQDDEERQELRSKYTSRLVDIAEDIRDKRMDNAYMSMDMAGDAIVDSLRGAKTVSAIDKKLRQWAYLDIKENTAQDVLDLYNDILQMVTDYFEAKPTRAVGLDEIAYVVIPTNPIEGLVEALDEYGIPHYDYVKDDNESRTQVVNDYLDDYEDALFNKKVDSDLINWHSKNVGPFEVKINKAGIQFLDNYTVQIPPQEYKILNSAVLENNGGNLNPNTIGCETTFNNLYIYIVDSSKRLKVLDRSNYGKIEQSREDLGEQIAEDISQLWFNGEGSGIIDVYARNNRKYREIANAVRDVVSNRQKRDLSVANRGKEGNIYSSKVDSDGNNLTDQQTKYFSKSEIRDDDGNLLVVYHGTPSGGFTVFNGAMNYFTANKAYAERYTRGSGSGRRGDNPQMYKGYLNIVKPFTLSDSEAKRIYIDEYIKGGYAQGINPLSSKAEIEQYAQTIDWVEADNLKEFFDEKGYDYDGIILNEGGDLTDNGTVMRGDSYVTFASNQFKSIENKNPTDNKDIRFSTKVDDPIFEILGLNKKLEKENKALKADVDALKEYIRLDAELSNGKKWNPVELNSVSKYLADKYNSDTDMIALRKSLATAYTYITEQLSNGNESWEDIMDECYSVATDVYNDIKNKPTISKTRITNEIQKAGIKADADVIKEVQNAVTLATQEEYVRQIAVDIYNGYWRASNLKTQADIKKEATNKLKSDKTKIKQAIENKNKEIQRLKFEHRKTIDRMLAEQKLADQIHYGKVIEQVREDREKKLTELKQFVKDRDARLKNAAERRKIIAKITEVSEDLSKRLLKGEKGKKVPQALKAPLAELLTAIDYSSKQLLGINAIKKAGIETKRDIAMSALLNRVSLALQGFNDAKAEGDDAYDLAGLHLPPNYATSLQEIADTIAKVEQTAEGTYVLQYMTAEELNDLYKAIKAIRTAINNVNRIISTNNAHEVDYLGNEIMTYLDKLGQRKIDNKVTQFMEVANKTPYYFFKHMGRGGQEVFSFLQNGWDKLADNVEVIKNFTRGKKKDGSDALYTSQEYDKWKNTVHEFDVLEAPTAEERAEGKEGRQRRITMTEAQIMALYCLSKREQAMGHISRDGIVIDEIKTKKKYGKHEIKKQDAVTLAPTDLGKILSVVTSDARMKQVSDKIQEFMSTVCAEWGNEVTMKLYGTEEFTEKNYFPIHVNQEILSTEAKDKSHSIYGMLNQSFTKPLTEGARNEINIADIFDVFNAHASDMAKYNALALPIMDVIKVWNYKENLDRGDNGQREVKAVKKSITKAIGKAGNSYISGLLRDLNGDAESGRYDKTSMRLVKNYKTAAVAANIQTALLQPLAYIRAGYMVNPKYLRKALTRKPKVNECIRDLGVQKWKSMGFYDTNLTRGLDKIISNSDNLFDTIVDKSLWLTEKMDEVTWGYLYTAVELETKDKYPSLSGEKLKEQTIKRLRDVVYGTQVFDSTLARTAMMRSTSSLVQMETSFGAEPILSVNMLMDAATEFNQEARRTDFATAVSKKGKLLARASAVYLVASVVESALRAALKRIRDYDDEDDTFEGLTSDILERTLEELDVLNKIPWVKEAMPYIRKFVYKKLGFEEMSKSIYADNARMDTEVFATIDSAIKSIDKALEGENLTYKDVQKISQALSQTSGLPISNVIKEFKVVWNNTVGRITGNTIK